MSDAPKKPSNRPPEPPRTKSGQMPSVKAYREKLDSIADGELGDAIDLSAQIKSFVEQLRASKAPATAATPPPLPPPSEVPISSDDIVGWDDQRDQPIRRRDLAASVIVSDDEKERWAREADTAPRTLTFPDEADTKPEQIDTAPTVPPPPAHVYAGTGKAEGRLRQPHQLAAQLLRPKPRK